MMSSQQLSLFLATLAISTAAPLFRQLGDMNPLLAAGLRLLVAAVLLSCLGGFRVSRLTPIQRRSSMWCGLFYAMHFGAWVSSLHYTSIAASVTLVTTTPILLLCLAVFKGEKRSRTEIFSCIVATLGVCCIAGADWQMSSSAIFGDLLALVGAMAMAGYFLAVKPLGELPLRPFMCLTALVGGLILVFACALTDSESFRQISLTDWYWIIALALVPHLLGHGLLTFSLRQTSPTAVALATVGEPAGSALLAYLFLSEVIGPLTAIGRLITLTAIFVGTRQPKLS